MSTTNTPIKVLYIAGEGRSGSTIMGNVLGEIDGFFFIGEAISIWHHFLIHNRLCACGVPANNCPTWQKILNIAFNLKVVDAHKMEKQGKTYARNRFLWKILLSNRTNKLHKEVAEYLHHTKNLYHGISIGTNTEVIVDSSKKPTYAFLLNMIPSIEVYILHLVRDSRGVAHSWGKGKIQQQVSDEVIYMHQFTPLKSAWRWNISNLLTELLLRHPPQNFLTIRYEDFVEEPAKTLSKVLQLLNLSERNFPIRAHNQAHLTTNHAIWGNPNRFLTGNITLRHDREWQQTMPTKSKRIITLLTKPGLRRYQYL